MGTSGLQFGCFGGILGALEVSWVPWLAPLGPDWRLGSQPWNFSEFFDAILGAILDDFGTISEAIFTAFDARFFNG